MQIHKLSNSGMTSVEIDHVAKFCKLSLQMSPIIFEDRVEKTSHVFDHDGARPHFINEPQSSWK